MPIHKILLAIPSFRDEMQSFTRGLKDYVTIFDAGFCPRNLTHYGVPAFSHIILITFTPGKFSGCKR